MARTNRRYASERMKRNNPMRNEESRQKMSENLKFVGRAPIRRGGNGSPATIPEVALFVYFATKGFQLRPVITTGVKRCNPEKIPFSYKPDLANFTLKIALEADGPSHVGKRKTLDQKKDEFLRGLGWTVLRFTNEDILTNPDFVMTTVLSTISRLKGCTLTLPTAL
jgi:hypothetical protein